MLSFCVSFSFLWGGRFRFRSWLSVSRLCRSRSEAARLLWRFRAARRWWRSSSAPPLSVVGGCRVPFRGFRWLAARWVVVRVSVLSGGPVSGRGCVLLRQRVFVVPAGRFVRRPSAFVPARLSSFARRASAVFSP